MADEEHIRHTLGNTWEFDLRAMMRLLLILIIGPILISACSTNPPPATATPIPELTSQIADTALRNYLSARTVDDIVGGDNCLEFWSGSLWWFLGGSQQSDGSYKYSVDGGPIAGGLRRAVWGWTVHPGTEATNFTPIVERGDLRSC